MKELDTLFTRVLHPTHKDEATHTYTHSDTHSDTHNVSRSKGKADGGKEISEEFVNDLEVLSEMETVHLYAWLFNKDVPVPEEIQNNRVFHALRVLTSC